MKKIKIVRYLTIDRYQRIGVRKQKCRLDDGEFMVKLVMNVPREFFTKPQTCIPATIDVKLPPLSKPEIVATNEL